MDLSKTFNCLTHDLILAKLHLYGVDIKSFKLLQDYLSNGTQKFKVDFTLSSWLTILLSVSQGLWSVHYFSIFSWLNDLLWFADKTDICNFANDNIYSCAKSMDNVLGCFQPDLKISLNLFKDNQMTANPENFQFLILSKNTTSQLIVINNKTIESSKSVKLIGLTTDT